jgi:hypothetical protein|nr:MAG TPA: Minor capsid protein from bacteriophage [Caudoviricetes sp.]
MNLVESLKNYFNTYQGLQEETIFVNFLKEKGSSFSIIPSPTQPVTRYNIDGTYEKRFTFSLVGRFNYSQEIRMNIENSSFFQDLEEWLINNNEQDIYPDLGDGYRALGISVISNGYLLGISPDGKTGQYEIRFELQYEKE